MTIIEPASRTYVARARCMYAAIMVTYRYYIVASYIVTYIYVYVCIKWLAKYIVAILYTENCAFCFRVKMFNSSSKLLATEILISFLRASIGEASQWTSLIRL